MRISSKKGEATKSGIFVFLGKILQDEACLYPKGYPETFT